MIQVTLGADDGDLVNRRGDGKYREVLIYNRALTAQEMVLVEQYLRAKWGTG